VKFFGNRSSPVFFSSAYQETVFNGRFALLNTSYPFSKVADPSPFQSVSLKNPILALLERL